MRTNGERLAMRLCACSVVLVAIAYAASIGRTRSGDQSSSGSSSRCPRERTLAEEVEAAVEAEAAKLRGAKDSATDLARSSAAEVSVNREEWADTAMAYRALAAVQEHCSGRWPMEAAGALAEQAARVPLPVLFKPLAGVGTAPAQPLAACRNPEPFLRALAGRYADARRVDPTPLSFLVTHGLLACGHPGALGAWAEVHSAPPVAPGMLLEALHAGRPHASDLVAAASHEALAHALCAGLLPAHVARIADPAVRRSTMRAIQTLKSLDLVMAPGTLSMIVHDAPTPHGILHAVAPLLVSRREKSAASDALFEYVSGLGHDGRFSAAEALAAAAAVYYPRPYAALALELLLARDGDPIISVGPSILGLSLCGLVLRSGWPPRDALLPRSRIGTYVSAAADLRSAVRSLPVDLPRAEVMHCAAHARLLGASEVSFEPSRLSSSTGGTTTQMHMVTHDIPAHCIYSTRTRRLNPIEGEAAVRSALSHYDGRSLLLQQCLVHGVPLPRRYVRLYAAAARRDVACGLAADLVDALDDALAMAHEAAFADARLRSVLRAIASLSAVDAELYRTLMAAVDSRTVHAVT